MRAVYPGTFDPCTNGHYDLLIRSAQLFDEVIVAVAKNASKSPLLSLEDRCEILARCTDKNPKIRVESFDCLLVEFAQSLGARVVIRGLRAVSDFEYELQMGYANQSLNPAIEILYLMPSLQNAFVSSSIVRSIIEYGGKISHLVPKEAFEFLRQRGYACI
ncbi:pantetheine-phosphate adenylyltransferase [Helicobacter pametensis]|uniref:pantetheine-phosphate adenylyltransferase n=1 Tax=Helicobacter pametensis TaxID=95149 RepID=UPI000481EA01|nr:pantetheine-phosphate adenylyltransferase [Helicobacter pametensis]